MPATPKVPTWQIFPTADGHYRWSLAGGDADRGSPEISKNLSSRLPSMADLVRQSPSKFLEPDGGDRSGELPMFRTGSGKSVAIQKSSIQKARSVLGGGDAMDRGDEIDDDFPSFGNGSGKSVTVRQSSFRKVATILGEDADKGAVAAAVDGVGNDDGFPMFRTGSGKSVTLRESSIRKAAAVLGEDAEKEFLKPPYHGSKSDVPISQTASGKSVLVNQSSINRAISVLQNGDNMETDKAFKLFDDRPHTFSNSLFQTGSGKAVNVSSAGLSKATTLLGLEADGSLFPSKYIESAIHHLDTNVTAWDGTKFRMPSPTGATCTLAGAQSDTTNSFAFSSNLYLENQPYKYTVQNHKGSVFCTSDSGQPPLKFQTAGGKSLSISSDALKRARSLLGDSEVRDLHNNVKPDQSVLLVRDEKNVEAAVPFVRLHQNADAVNHLPKILPHIPTFTNQLKPVSARDMSLLQEPFKKGLYAAHAAVTNKGKSPGHHNSVVPLADISNIIQTDSSNMNGFTSEKNRSRRRISISPFKRPRISRFTTPVNDNLSFSATDSTKFTSSENCCPRTRVSSHYPFKIQRKTLRDFFGGPPIKHNLFRQLSDKVQHMNPDNAEIYRFSNASGSDEIGSENFENMLLRSGAALSSATKVWVTNHYKWIVWKLACLERCYPNKASGKFLTASNVLEELKYRYDREINHGHRSTLKKVLDGDASPASMMVLCISSIYSHSAPDINKLNDMRICNEAVSHHATKIELTDGWYSLDAILDPLLSKQLAAEKLFVGQKLRIWGAGLCGWVGPISPLEASKTVSLLIHINGTYRAHWSDPLGLCKNLGAPLAFSCIRGAGGKVPRTLVGITRIYPVLYKERSPDGGSIVRSERMEKNVLQLHNQRRSDIIEDIMSEQCDPSMTATDSEEGARIYRILEASADPEVLMADMSSEQLMSFSTYQSKQEAIRQSSMQKKVEKALEDAGLISRDVTPFMRVRVVGLTSKGLCRSRPQKEGLITIWNPTEQQKHDLVEGQIYSVSGLMPLNFGSDILYLQARGSSTVWKPVLSISEKFEPFFTPRKPLLLSNLGEVPLASEFDMAAVVVHVGDVFISGSQKKQWIFVTDGSKCSSELEIDNVYDCLLAISFCSPAKDDDSSGLLSQSLAGTTVVFCNLVKRARDQMNHLWVAEATENSTYSVGYNAHKSLHLKGAADSVKQWSKVSSSIIQNVRERVLCIVGGGGS